MVNTSRKSWISFALVFVFSACALPPPAVDPITGLGNISISPEPQSVKAMLGSNVAVVLTENTRNVVAYENSLHNSTFYNDYFSLSAETTQVNEAETDPTALAAGPAYELRKFVPQIWLAPDINTAKAKGATYAVLLDITEQDRSNHIINLGTLELVWSYKFIFVRLGGQPSIVVEVDGISDNTCPMSQSVNGEDQDAAKCDMQTRQLALSALDSNMQSQFSP